MHLPYPEIPHRPPPGFRVREAELSDVEEITRVRYAAYNPSHEFYKYGTPDDPVSRQWFDELWARGIMAGPSVTRIFVAKDMSQGNKIVAFARWHVPQTDGIQRVPLPPFPAHWDAEIAEALWGGMARSREALTAGKPHWAAGPLAIDPAYQKTGLVFALAEWGLRQAAVTGLAVYANASERGWPVWSHYGCKKRGVVRVPGRQGQFKPYELVALVWEADTKVNRSNAARL